MLKSYTNNRIVIPLFLLAALPMLATGAGNGGKYGTDVFHYSVRQNFTDAGSGNDASGRVTVARREQGNAAIQSLDIAVQRLDTSAPYHLLAWLDQATNYTYVAAFNTDENGRATLRYRAQAQGKALGQAGKQLPAQVNPVTLIEELVIADVNTQAVLSADLGSADKLQYLLKKNLSTNQVDAILRIKANSQVGKLRLNVYNLQGPSPYALGFNGEATEALTPDDKGRVVVDSNLDNPLGVLDLSSVTLWDSESNVVFSATLP